MLNLLSLAHSSFYFNYIHSSFYFKLIHQSITIVSIDSLKRYAITETVLAPFKCNKREEEKEEERKIRGAT
jgi:hypothetical protein